MGEKGKEFGVLLVEDDEVDRIAIKRALAKSGLKVEVTETGTANEGLEKFNKGNFDCVLLDYGLPDMEGLDFLKKIRLSQGGESTPIIMLTGREFEEVALETFRAGAQDFLEKNKLTPLRLSQAILSAIERQGLSSPNRKIRKELKEKSDFLKVIDDTMAEGLLVTDEKGKILSVNKSCEKIFGYSEKQMLGENLKILMPEESPWKHEQWFENDRKKGKSDNKEAGPRGGIGKRKNGEHFALEIAINRVLEHDHFVFIGFVRDVSERKKVEADNLRLGNILEDSFSEIYVIEPKTLKFSYVNKQGRTNLGFTMAELRNMTPVDLAASFAPKKIRSFYRSLWTGEKNRIEIEGKHKRKDGSVYNVDLRMWLFKAGRSPVLVVTAEDITEKKKAVGATKEAEEKLKLIAENSIDIICLHDREGKNLFVTTAFKRHLGYDHKKEIGKSSFRLMHPDEKKRFKETWIKTVIENNQPFRADIRLKAKDGKYIWFESVSSPVKDASGKVIGAVSTSRNLTDYKKAEAESLRFGRIVEDSLNQIYIIDAETLQFLSVNRGARENLGYSMEELQGMTPLDIKPQFTKKSFLDLIKPLYSGKSERVNFEALCRRKDGTNFEVEVYLQLSKTGLNPVFIAITEDITDKKAADEKLRQAQKMEAIGHLTGGVAHDFNNLLTAILGSLQLLKMTNEKLSKDGQECINIALNASRRGADLTHRLLAFSRKQNLKPSILEINALLRKLIPMFQRTIHESIEIETRLMKTKVFVEVDKSELESSLLNLAVNARDAMPNGGHLVFKVEKKELTKSSADFKDIVPGTYVVLSVSDDGAGMSPEVRDHVFEPFFSTKSVDKGTGLGLSMVYGFVKQSGGHIAVDSKPGKGTTFKLYLKATKNKKLGKVQKPKSIDLFTKASGTILLVEDDEGVRKLLTKALKGKGYTVWDVEDGPSALLVMEDHPEIDLLLTDMVLPKGMSGVEISKEFSGRYPESGIIFSSGYPGKAMKKNERLKGKDKILSKPYDLKVLLELVRSKMALSQ